MKSLNVLLVSILFTLLTFLFQNGSPPTPKILGETESGIDKNKEASPETFLVKRIVDGDTILLENGQRVRYIGIDTPETVDPRKPAQCFGKQASDKNKELVEGKIVRLEKDISETDKYGRLLRYVYTGDTLVNKFLVEEGFAYSSTYQPDVKYQEIFKNAQKEAQQKNKGLWSACFQPKS